MIGSLTKVIKKTFRPTEDEVKMSNLKKMVSHLKDEMKTMNPNSLFLIEGFCKALQNDDVNVTVENGQTNRGMFMGFYSVSFKVDNLQVIAERNAPKQYDQRDSIKIMVYNESINAVEDFTEYYTEALQRLFISLFQEYADLRKKENENKKSNFLKQK